MRSISELTKGELAGVRVLVRSSLNVPVAHGEVQDVFRLQRAAETLHYLSEAGARVIVIGHIGRDPQETLAPVAAVLRRYVPCQFVSGDFREAEELLKNMQAGEIMVLENLRRYPGEVANDMEFATHLAQLGDIFVQDAFSVCHRQHASIVGVPTVLPSYAGLLLADEVAHLTSALTPAHPSLAILGGAKFDTKKPLIRRLLETYDHVFVAGALMNDLWKGKGYEVGRSVISDIDVPNDVLTHARLITPVDATVEDTEASSSTKLPEEMTKGDKIVDIGPASFDVLATHIKNAQYILWNGPTGLYEDGYGVWTDAIGKAVAVSAAQSVVGGGDTLAVLDEETASRFSFVSTGGGAMLEFLLQGTLPGIAALD